MKLRLISGVVQMHRVILISSTAFLSVGGSQVAEQLKTLGGWLLMSGAGLGMYLSILLQDVDLAARKLAEKSGAELKKTRLDSFECSIPGTKMFGGKLLMACIMIIVGFVVSGK